MVLRMERSGLTAGAAIEGGLSDGGGGSFAPDLDLEAGTGSGKRGFHEGGRDGALKKG